MKVIFAMMAEQTRLEVSAASTDDPVKLKAAMRESAKNLAAAAEAASATWGTLTHAVKSLEKGERFAPHMD